MVSCTSISKSWVFRSLSASLFIVFILEVFFAWLSHQPFRVEPWRSVFRQIYADYFRRLLTVAPECGVYDSRLFYRLKPGSCRFRNWEFDVTYHVNSQGLRDDEASLVSPQVISLGDSFSVGWGVEQEENFPSLLERRVGLRTLTAGVPSYGTARQTQLVSELDTSQLRYLIIQYCGNDLSENEQLVADGVLHISSQAQFEMAGNFDASIARYWPGKYLGSFMAVALRRVLGREPRPSRDYRREVDLFLKVLSRMKLNDTVTVVLFEMDDRQELANDFAEELRARIMIDNDLPQFLRTAVVLDTDGIMSDEDYLPIDGHLNTAGEAKLADAVASIIENDMRATPR